MQTRTTTKGREIIVNGKGVYTFDANTLVEFPGGDIQFNIAGSSTASTTPEQRTYKMGDTIKANGKIVQTFVSGKYVIDLPGTDLVYTALVPTPTPTNGIEVKSGSNALILKSGLNYYGLNRPVVTKGILLNSGVQDVTVRGIDFVGDSTMDGIRGIVTKCKNLTFEDCRFKKFRAGFTLQNLNIGPLSDYNKNFTFRYCQFLDMTGTGDKEGHGGFIMTQDGVLYEECLIDGAGFAKTVRHIFTHGVYDQHGNRNDRFSKCIISRCESVGIQARGSLNRDTDPDDGTPGPVINDNLIIDCAIGIMVNGPRAEVRRNLIQVGHYHTSDPKSGQGGVYASVGKLALTDNVRVNGPTGSIGTSGTRIAPYINNPRPYKDKDVHTGQLVKWEWNQPTSYSENTNNRDLMGVTPDFSDLVKRARAGERCGGLIQEAWSRIP